MMWETFKRERLRTHLQVSERVFDLLLKRAGVRRRTVFTRDDAEKIIYTWRAEGPFTARGNSGRHKQCGV